MCHLPLTKGEVGASTVERSSFLSASLNIKQFTINMHSNKVLRKHDMHDMQHTSRHMLCMICKLLGNMDNINKPVGWSKVKIKQNKLYTKLIKYLTSTN